MLSHPTLANSSIKGDHPKRQKVPSLIISHLQYKTPPVNKKNRHYYTLTFAQKVTKNTIIDNQLLTLPNTPQ